MERELTVRKLYLDLIDKKLNNLEKVHIYGWVKSIRDNGSVGFIEFNDGSYFKSIQLVFIKESKCFEKASKIKYGSAIEVFGEIKLTPEAKQPFEIQLDDVNLVGDCAEDYPLQKKKHSFEFLRDIAYLRPRANTFQALYRVRNTLAFAVHKYFQEHGFIYVHTPIITGNDAEGAGEVFRVIVDPKNPTDFFKANAVLTVSGQLHVEPFALAFRDVYTFGPTFRAENSNTPRHANEFWMIEPELAFADLNDDMDCIESCLKYVIKYVLENCPDEMSFFDNFIEKGTIEKLTKVISKPFKKLSYTDGIKYLQEAVKNGHQFEYSKIEWGMDLQSEHERYLTEEIVKGPVFLTDFPKDIKAFYMKRNKDGKTVAATDLLVPQEGEIVGASQREDDYEVLKEVMTQKGNDKELEWYLNLRKYGGCPHSGFGIGFDRLLMYITGMKNIRDTEPYPRVPGGLKY
jgi:asparaginyl-tRNA synthetase